MRINAMMHKHHHHVNKKHVHKAPARVKVGRGMGPKVQHVAQNIQPLEKQAFDGINSYRQSKGLRPLVFSQALYDQAKAHSSNMASGSTPFSHDGFDKRFKAVKTQIKVKSFAENVAFNKNVKSPASSAVQGWIASPGHHKNIVGDYNLTAMAVAKSSSGSIYFTQLFAKA